MTYPTMSNSNSNQKTTNPSTKEESSDEETQVSTPVQIVFSFLKQQILIKDFQDFFRILCYFIIGLFVFFINGLIQFRQYTSEKGIYTIPWHYNLISVCVVFALFGFKKLLRVYLKDWIIENMSDKYVGPQREIRATKVLKWIQDSTYYSCTTHLYLIRAFNNNVSMSIEMTALQRSDYFDMDMKKLKMFLGYCLALFIFLIDDNDIFSLIAFRNEPFMPSVFGGSGECSQILANYPQFPENNVILFYHLIQFGCHSYSLFELVIFRRNEDSKFYEFTLHHFMAAGLIFYSGMFNLMYVSVIVLITHDMGDIFVAGGRAYADMKHKNKYVLYLIMVSALIVWIGSRIFLFPSCIIYTCWLNIGETIWGVWEIVKHVYYYLLIQLIILFFMHCYWTIFMLKIVFDYAMKPVYKNHYDDQDFQKHKERQEKGGKIQKLPKEEKQKKNE